MRFLSNSTLADLPDAVERPYYDRGAVSVGIVHLGLGAFHRAHAAVATEAVLNGGDRRWGICGVSLRAPDTRDALEPQDGLYTVLVRDGSGDRLQVVGAINQTLVAPENAGAVLDALCAPSTRIVTLTVTEKGYCHRPSTGALDETHPDILHDLADPERPRTAAGFLTEAIRRRRDGGLPPFTVLCCDNLPSNGRTLGNVVARFAQMRDPELGAYVRAAVPFPSTMVDRIVPATTDVDRAVVEAALGLADRWPVVTEPFTQWVIEDRFASGRPDWPGATFVADVEPFELMKLRLLNGSHSTLSYLGLLDGRETVADTMAAPGFAAFLAAMMREEVSPTLPALPGFDVASYRDTLLARFRNPALRHRTAQIAMDGSQKIPQRLLGTIRDRLREGRPFPRLALGVAAWMLHATGRDRNAAAVEVRDPMAARIREVVGERTGAAELLDGYLRLDEVFGEDLAASDAFRAAVGGALEALLRDGAAASVLRWAESDPK